MGGTDSAQARLGHGDPTRRAHRWHHRVDQTQVHLWLSTFGVSSQERERVKGQWEAMLDDLFPQAAGADAG